MALWQGWKKRGKAGDKEAGRSHGVIRKRPRRASRGRATQWRADHRLERDKVHLPLRSAMSRYPWRHVRERTEEFGLPEIAGASAFLRCREAIAVG